MISNKKKIILFIHHGKGIGGAPKSMSYIAKGMQKEGYEIKILFLFNSDAIKLYDNLDYNIVGLKLFYFNHTSSWVRLKEFYWVIIQLISWLITVFFVAPYWFLKLKPDMIYLNSSVLTDWSFAAKILKISNVVHVREAVSNGYFGIRRNIIKNLLNFSANKIIYISKHNYNRLNTIKNKSYVVYNYVRDLPEGLECADKKYDFIYVGGHKEIKGISFIQKLIEQYKHKTFLLLGYYNEEFVSKYSKFKNVRMHGAVTNAIEFISKSSFLLFPATQPHFPRPIIEAYSVGTIPIASDLEGIDEVVKDGVTGFLYKNNDILDFEFALIKIEGIDYSEITKNAFEIYIKKFSVENEQQIYNILKDTLNNHGKYY